MRGVYDHELVTMSRFRTKSSYYIYQITDFYFPNINKEVDVARMLPICHAYTRTVLVSVPNSLSGRNKICGGL